MTVLALLAGFYAGGGFVTSIVTRTVDGVACTMKDTLVLALCWPYVLATAGDPE